MKIFWIVFACLIAALFLFYIFPTFLISFVIYSILLVRQNKKKWSREVSWDNEEQKEMFAIGAKWGEDNEAYHSKKHIKNGKFNLVGEYFDFGFDRAVIIIPGRMEAGTYSYYFSEPYKKCGFNVLAIDNRSHGESDGRYNTLGLKEYADIIKWAKYLHDELGNKKIIVHGICIGSATALYSYVWNNNLDYMVGLVADGMYESFSKSLKNHLIEKKKKNFPYNAYIMMFISIVAGKGINKNAPINVIDKLNKPILFLYSKEDIYSTADQANALYDKCKAEKRIVWFDKGVHSHIRINNLEKYDQTIADFVKDYVDGK